MIIRVEHGKGGHDRDLPLSPALLETLREYWRWKKPKTYLFPSDDGHRGKDQPISDESVWYACKQAALHAGFNKRVTPHTLRHYTASETMPLNTEGDGGRPVSALFAVTQKRESRHSPGS
jgi:integrase/recombinase XerD